MNDEQAVDRQSKELHMIMDRFTRLGMLLPTPEEIESDPDKAAEAIVLCAEMRKAKAALDEFMARARGDA